MDSCNPSSRELVNKPLLEPYVTFRAASLAATKASAFRFAAHLVLAPSWAIVCLCSLVSFVARPLPPLDDTQALVSASR